jgi:hypothetical protein
MRASPVVSATAATASKRNVATEKKQHSCEANSTSLSH